MQLDEIKEIVELMITNDLMELELEEQGCRIALKRGIPAASVASTVVPSLATAPAATASGTGDATTVTAAAPADDDTYELIKAPFVGTFYGAPSPESPPYVQIGQEVGPDTVLCIVEAMKVMNEIKAEVCGIVRAIMVENSRAVQYGQPLFKIEKT